MKDYCAYFKGKRITVIGLGLLGRGVSDIAFLAECGADLIITDKKTEEELAPSLEQLKSYDISYDLGGHTLEDFRDRDMILKAASVPLDSPYIKEAKKNNIPVRMSASLVASLSGATIVGVTGTRGKSTTTMLIYEILKATGREVFLGGNIRDALTLPLLAEVAEGDLVVMELDSWQLQGFGESKISPHIAVFTTFLPDHMNYYANNMQVYFDDKAHIFKYQKEGDVLITTNQSHDAISRYYNTAPKNEIVVKPVQTSNPYLIGDHNKENVACAVEVARTLGVSEDVIRKAIESFEGVEGRLQFLREVGGVSIYNDNNATTPDSTLVALRSLGTDKNIVLIMGGSDKGLDMSKLLDEIPKYCKATVLLAGTGTDKLIKTDYQLRPEHAPYNDLPLALAGAIQASSEGDIILFSPAFASFGMFKNEYERNDQFVKLVDEYGS